MNKEHIIRLLTEVRAGRHTAESLQQAITTGQLPKDLRGQLQLQALEKVGTLVQRQDPGFVERATKLNADLKQKYGNNPRSWPDAALDEIWDLYIMNSVYAKMLNLDTWLNNNNLKKFIKWIDKETETCR